jgi:hypothetical protein
MALLCLDSQERMKLLSPIEMCLNNLKRGCLHPVVCITSGSEVSA